MKKWASHFSTQNVISRNEQHKWDTLNTIFSLEINKKINNFNKRWTISTYCMLDGGRGFVFFTLWCFFVCFDVLCFDGCLVEERSVDVSFLFATKIFKHCRGPCMQASKQNVNYSPHGCSLFPSIRVNLVKVSEVRKCMLMEGSLEKGWVRRL
jgi:hypothetical protein